MNNKVLLGEKEDFSPKTFFGEEFTYEQVKEFSPQKKYQTLLWSMRVNKIPRVVKTRFGRFYPLEEEDKVVENASALY